MTLTSTTGSSTMHVILFSVLLFLALNVSANCNNDKCLNALNSDFVVASSFCSVYTTNTAIATPLPISSGCKASPSKILSACSCINSVIQTTTSSPTSVSTSKSSSISQKTTLYTSRTTQPSMSGSTSSTKASMTSSTSRISSITTSTSRTVTLPTTTTTPSSVSQSASTKSCPTVLPTTVTVTIVSTTAITASLTPATVTQTQTQTQTATTTTSLYPSPCSLYEAGIPSCVLNDIVSNFADFQPNCFGAGRGPSFTANCICPYLSQLPSFLQNSECAASDITSGLQYQQLECQCLGATIG